MTTAWDNPNFVSAHTDAWNFLGTRLNRPFTALEALQEANLAGWNVRKSPVFTREDGKTIPVPGRYAVLRDVPGTDDVQVLGDVGKDLTLVQNEGHAEFLDTLVEESGANYETAGAIDGGRKVFLTMKLPGHIQVGGVDRVDNYIAGINSHDGSACFTLMVTPVRFACANMMNLAMSQASHIIKIRHTRGIHKALVTRARTALDITFKYLDDFQRQADQLINTTMTEMEFEKLVVREFGPSKDAAPATVTRTERKIDEMVRLFADAGTQAGIRNTAWAGLNAITEWADHYSPTRGDDRDGARAEKAVLDPAFKNRALQLMLTWAPR